jgi:hypothetical protein
VIKSRPFPPAELLLELATRAELMTSPLTTGASAPEYASTFERAVETLLSSSHPPPVLSDPELAVVARVAARDPSHAEDLRASIAALRSDLAGHAEKIGDERLNGLLASSAAAATDFDPDAHALPLPDDDNFAAAINVVSQRAARVTDKLRAAGSRVPIEVIHSSMYYRMLISRPRYFEGARVEDLARSYSVPMVHRLAESEAVTRLAARDIESQDAVVEMLERAYWQHEWLRQTIDAEPLPTPEMFATKTEYSDAQANQIFRLHHDLLTFSIQVAQGLAAGIRHRLLGAWADIQKPVEVGRSSTSIEAGNNVRIDPGFAINGGYVGWATMSHFVDRRFESGPAEAKTRDIAAGGGDGSFIGFVLGMWPAVMSR